MLTLECIFVPRNSLHLLQLTLKYWDLFWHLLFFIYKYCVILYMMLISICTVLCVCVCVCVCASLLTQQTSGLLSAHLSWNRGASEEEGKISKEKSTNTMKELNFFLLVATFQPDDVFAEVFSSLSVCEWLFELKICKDLSYKHVTHLATVQE